MSSVKLCLLFFLQQRNVVPSCQKLKFFYHIRSKERFIQEIIHTYTFGIIHNFFPVIGSKDYHHCVFIILTSYFLCHLKPVLIRHLPVKEHKVIRLHLCLLYFKQMQGTFAVRAGICLYTHLLKHDLGVLGRNLFIIHYQDPYVPWVYDHII